jgi:cation diffusion facilitator CzcD-associated flavoprotein CzcO
MAAPTCDVAIIGAGPYGLAAAAHLRAAGVDVRVFGEALEFWKNNMPVGMLLRSSWDASQIADPAGALTLDRYEATQVSRLSRPLPLADFVAYGLWFQRDVVPDLDRRRVQTIGPISGLFRLVADDGDSVLAGRVVVATGLADYEHRPSQFRDLPASIATHTSNHGDLSRFAHQRVAVVGGGQSAIESAALLAEGGADVEVILRASGIRWLTRSAWLHGNLAPVRGLLYHRTDVGPPGLNQIVARPEVFRLLPRSLQQWVAYQAIRPAASGWLRPRAAKVRITPGREVAIATVKDGRAVLMLDDGSQRVVDHVLLATGYRVDVTKNPILSETILRSLRYAGGYPELRNGLESSIDGLHFLGAAAGWSYGPLMRFVSGTEFAAQSLTRRVVGRMSVRQPRRGLSV